MILQDPEKQDGVGDLFGGMVNSDEFFKLVTIGKMITDFQSPEDPQEGDVLAGDALDEEAGVAVEFEGEDADDDDDEGDEVMVSKRQFSSLLLLDCNKNEVSGGSVYSLVSQKQCTLLSK